MTHLLTQTQALRGALNLASLSFLSLSNTQRLSGSRALLDTLSEIRSHSRSLTLTQSDREALAQVLSDAETLALMLREALAQCDTLLAFQTDALSLTDSETLTEALTK